MDLTGWTDRRVRRNRDRLACRPGPLGKKGKPRPLYALSRLPLETQLKWAQRREVVPISTEAPCEGAGQLAFDLAIPVGCNLTTEELAKAEERYRVIAPLIEPEKHRALWAGRTKDQVVELLATRHTRTLKKGGTAPLSKRTIYNWLARWEGKKDDRGGIAALVDRDRRDKGKPRKLNAAGFDLVVKLLTPKAGPNGYGELAVRDAFIAYEEERRWRLGITGVILENGDAQRLQNYVDDDGRLFPEAQLPRASYPTFWRWVKQLPKPLLTLGRKGREAFDNTEVPYSYRNLAKLKPLEWVVMDHRQLDVFCLARAPKGWKLIRPWVTAALDMRTRRWLSWVIVEQPNSHSIATVVKRLLLEHGRPQAFYWDNGQDFECHWLDGVLQSLQIKVTHSSVKRARSKIIEPNFRSLAHFERQLPWWTGHKPEARPDERLEVLQTQHERWIQGQGRSSTMPTSSSSARPRNWRGFDKPVPAGKEWCVRLDGFSVAHGLWRWPGHSLGGTAARQWDRLSVCTSPSRQKSRKPQSGRY